MVTLPITMASRAYDGIAPLVRGEVAIPGVDLTIQLENSVPRVFAALYQGQVDISEMSLAELIYYTSRDRADFVALPVFPSRFFRHGHFFCRNDAGIDSLRDLTGRRIGFQRWVQTAGVWMRGILVDEYGVDPAATPWYVATTHHWDDAEHEAIEPRDGSVIHRYQSPSVTGADQAFRALLDGEVEIMGVTEVQAPALLADPRVRRLFPDYRAEEAAYFQRTRIYPIMHVLAMRRGLAAAHPELPARLFSAFAQAKRVARVGLHAVPSWSLAWKDAYIEEEATLFAGDPWPFGLAPNHHVIERFIGYCYAQGIAARPLVPRDLFHPSTWDLSEGM